MTERKPGSRIDPTFLERESMETILIKGYEVPASWQLSYEVPASWQLSSDVIVSSQYRLYVICESVRVHSRPLIVAAPQLFTALKNLHADVASGSLDSESLRVAGELIEELEKVK